MFFKQNRAKECLICESDIAIMHIIMLYMEQDSIYIFMKCNGARSKINCFEVYCDKVKDH